MKKLEERIASLSSDEQEKFRDVIKKCRNRQDEITKNRICLEESVMKIKSRRTDFNKSVDRFKTEFKRLIDSTTSSDFNQSSAISQDVSENDQNTAKPFITH